MALELKAGMKLRSAVCTGEFVVVKAPSGAADLRCGGEPVVAPGDDRPEGLAPADGLADGTNIGKRYTDEGGTIELLCSKAGTGSLTLDGAPLGLKDAKPLPSSD